jgi:transposase
MDGILGLHITEGSFDTEKFKLFISDLLDQMNPWPQPNSTIVMDNCQIHKDHDILEMIEARYVRCPSTYHGADMDPSGMKYLFLPPYSPDFNPIELAFSAIKAWIRRNGGLLLDAMTDGDEEEVRQRLAEAVWAVTAADARAWFAHAQSMPVE